MIKVKYIKEIEMVQFDNCKPNVAHFTLGEEYTWTDEIDDWYNEYGEGYILDNRGCSHYMPSPRAPRDSDGWENL